MGKGFRNGITINFNHKYRAPGRAHIHHTWMGLVSQSVLVLDRISPSEASSGISHHFRNVDLASFRMQRYFLSTSSPAKYLRSHITHSEW